MPKLEVPTEKLLSVAEEEGVIGGGESGVDGVRGHLNLGDSGTGRLYGVGDEMAVRLNSMDRGDERVDDEPRVTSCFKAETEEEDLRASLPKGDVGVIGVERPGDGGTTEGS